MAVTHIDDLNLPEIEIKSGNVVLEEGVTSSRILILQSGKVRVSAKGEEICEIDTLGAVLGES